MGAGPRRPVRQVVPVYEKLRKELAAALAAAPPGDSEPAGGRLAGEADDSEAAGSDSDMAAALRATAIADPVPSLHAGSAP